MSDDLNIHPAATDELHDIIRHYAVINDRDDEHESLALAFHNTFYNYVDEIVASPLSYSFRRPPTRRANLAPRFGEYYIAYMVWREKVVILAVAHAKRRPYYWRKRIGEAKKLF